MTLSLVRTDSAPRADPRVPDWSAIHDPDTPVLLLPMAAPRGGWVAKLLRSAPFSWRAEAAPDELAAALPGLPPGLRAAVDELALPFAGLMQARRLSLRLEGIVGNACTRVHADYTDVRLIRTLAGPGTDYAPPGADSGRLSRVPTGWTGLFKGTLYRGRDGAPHMPCLHRSPPIEGTGEARLLLVIDTVAA
jgi:hypothetical protein